MGEASMNVGASSPGQPPARRHAPRGVTVLHLVGSFQQGGSEGQAIQLCREQRNVEWLSVRLACLDKSGPLHDVASHMVDEIPAFPLTSFYDSNFVKQLTRFVNLLKKERVEIVHTHDFYTNVFGMSAAAIAGVPVRIASRRDTGALRTPWQLRVERQIFRLADKVVGNSD